MARYGVNDAAVAKARAMIWARQYATEETKARYAFVYGDFRRVHRSALIASVYRAAEWRHKQVEIAAHGLLQELDEVAGIS
ncbi:MAG: hypothetical protein JWP74_1823 [Marmoricola sp.]|nr:hypothetical protein [Marmoricola sp.]